MSNALMIYQEFDSMQRAAMALYKSGYFSDAKSEAQAIVKVMAGAELGLPPFASMAGIHIIQGKPTLGANVIATLVKNDPRYDYRVEQADDKTCVLKWLENGVVAGYAGFTMDEAKAAGLTNKDNWKKYPSDMLFARAISRGARRFAPGIFGGAPVYTPDEMGADVDEEGNVVEGEIIEQSEEDWIAQKSTPPSDRPKLQPTAETSKNGQPFYGAMAGRISFFTSADEVKQAMKILGVDYPKSKAAAAGVQELLEAFAGLRADGVEEELAVIHVKDGQPEPETETELY